MELPQGGESFRPWTRTAARSFGYVLEGSVVLLTGEERHNVHKGETFYFRQKQPHTAKTRKNDGKGLMISTPLCFEKPLRDSCPHTPCKGFQP